MQLLKYALHEHYPNNDNFERQSENGLSWTFISSWIIFNYVGFILIRSTLAIWLQYYEIAYHHFDSFYSKYHHCNFVVYMFDFEQLKLILYS